jgi:hypothetical protein
MSIYRSARAPVGLLQRTPIMISAIDSALNAHSNDHRDVSDEKFVELAAEAMTGETTAISSRRFLSRCVPRLHCQRAS